MFKNNKKCFVPRYEGDDMKMLALHSMEDYNTLPLTKWNIKQPESAVGRENALETGIITEILLNY